ncbi:MAG TPA: putative Na+/H+ antiporter [Patescibacteria group bacterium]|nr:putative Na+/H+ antiporter [Patescibacteria group bacterium]
MEWIGTALFALAVLHTFSTKFFDHLSHVKPAHAGIFHLLGEVEVVFGFWAMVLFGVFMAMQGKPAALAYVDGLNFTEPLFVFAIMVVAASRAVLQISRQLVAFNARLLPLPPATAYFLVVMSLVPLLGSFITEPAAMTLAALILRDGFYAQPISNRLKYATLGVLFVNISIGGVMTPYAAPPVLMVAGTWGWDIGFMMSHFGWRAAIAVLFNAALLTFLFRHELRALPAVKDASDAPQVPSLLVFWHLALLAGVVLFAHDPPVFLGLLLLFLAIAEAYPQHQNKLLLREALLVAFFLAGLVVLGGLQRWWLQPLLTQMSPGQVFFGATALTAITDNAALTYLGSLVEGLSDEFKYALVAGAVSGGGLTVIANAPNPAGFSILRVKFDEESISPIGLLLAALAPTAVAIVCFWFLP